MCALNALLPAFVKLRVIQGAKDIGVANHDPDVRKDSHIDVVEAEEFKPPPMAMVLRTTTSIPTGR